MEPLFAAVNLGFTPAAFTGMILGSMVAPLLLTIFLPFTASLLLDGIVFVLRGRGVRPLLLAFALTAVIAIAGLFALSMGGPDAATRFSTTAGFLLPWGCGLAGLAFLIRQVKAATARRQGRKHA